MKTVIISQARMTSTRLPGKILKEVLGKSLLEYQIERLRRVKLADELIIATTVNNTDQAIVELCEKLGVKYYRGSEEDVLSRYYEAAQQYRADVVVRVTSDCPLIDPAVVDYIIEYYLANQNEYDYVSNTLLRTYPRGMDTEVFPFRVLEEAHNKADKPAEREHVTPFLYDPAHAYKVAQITYNEDQSWYRWTVDTVEDFTLISKMLELLYPQNKHFSLEDGLDLVNRYPELKEINKDIQQKTI